MGVGGLLGALAAVAPAQAAAPTTDCAGTVCTVTYTYTGGLQSWSVPTGVTSANFDVFGAQGGSVTGTNQPVGGLGGETKGTLSVTPGDLYFVFVGGAGVSANSAGTSTTAAGGYNGGGAGGGPTSGDSGASGGGASDVRYGGTTLGDRLLVAGGGGGAASTGGSTGDGGAGGATTGGSGAGEAATDGTGGTQSAGGAAGNGGGASGTAGALGQGGNGGAVYSGGGGGGYYGGGGGGYDSTSGAYGPGGGGSSYAASTVSAAVLSSGVQSGNGKVIITYLDDDLSIGGVPSGVTATATSASGTVVTYTLPVALDPDLTTLPAVTCLPASGTTFPVGATTVNCSTTDSDDVTATASFTVTVTQSSGQGNAVSGATTVDTGEPWAGSTPYEAALGGSGAALIIGGLLRRRHRRLLAAGRSRS